MSWVSFWIGFLLVSLAIYAAVAAVVTARGGVELVTLVRSKRQAPPPRSSTESSVEREDTGG